MSMPRKPLSMEAIAAAARLKSIWESKKDALNMTQEDMSGALGFETQGAFSHYVNGHTPINLGALILIARTLNVTAHDIYPELAEKYLGGYVDFLDETERRIVQTTRKMTVEKRAIAQRGIDQLAQPETNIGDTVWAD